MQELENKTYQYTVKGISLIKSLEKEFPNLINKDLKENIGKVSIKFLDAYDAKENIDFANNLRESHVAAEKSLEILSSMSEIPNNELNKQKEQLIEESKSIISLLNSVIQKLIY